MKKIIIKTSIITICALSVLTLIFYGALSLFFPSVLAKWYDRAGNYDLSVSYYEKQYKSSSDTKDLFTLCIKLDEFEDSAKTQKYLKLLIASPEFEDICNDADRNKKTGDMSCEDFIEGKLCVATFKLEGIEKAIQIATECVGDEYAEFNPFTTLVTDLRLTLSNNDLIKISDALNSLKHDLKESEKIICQNDIEFIEDLIK